jgi:hypothetical protein
MINIFDEKVLCEYWDTPVLQSNELWLEMQFYTENQIVFFFKRNYDSPKNEYHVLTIVGDSPFRITEEGLGWKVVGDLLENNTAREEGKKGRTFKVWNTQFAIESFRGLAIPKEEYDKLEKFQYIIYTNDAWIQFVTFDPVKWEFHQNVPFKDLVLQYLSNDFLDE